MITRFSLLLLLRPTPRPPPPHTHSAQQQQQQNEPKSSLQSTKISSIASQILIFLNSFSPNQKKKKKKKLQNS
jgi:hypothetical protein